MQLLKPSELKPSGRFMMFYSNAGVGKTTSILSSMEYPALYGACEPRNPQLSIQIAGADTKDLDIVVFEKWEEVKAFFADDKNTERYNTIFLDGSDYLYNIDLSIEIEDEAYASRESEAGKKDEGIIKKLAGQVKMSEEGYGALAGQMIRLLKILGRLSQMGKTVIMTSHISEYPKWNRTLSAAPSFKGRMLNLAMPGFMDLIGLVETRTNENGKIIYPPLVRFESADDTFVAKYNGVKPEGISEMAGPLDIKKILQITQPKGKGGA